MSPGEHPAPPLTGQFSQKKRITDAYYGKLVPMSHFLTSFMPQSEQSAVGSLLVIQGCIGQT